MKGPAGFPSFWGYNVGMANWTYIQSTGEMSSGDNTFSCYSGAGDGKNNPAMQDQHNVGPVPKGEYDVSGPECVVFGNGTCPDCGAPENAHHHGPFVWRLHPDPANEMFGRGGFLIHGDNANHTASQGCIITSRAERNLFSAGDTVTVIA